MTEQQENDRTPENWFVLLVGLPLENDNLELGPGLVLRRIEEPITVFDLAAAGAKGFREWATLELLAPACACEIQSNRKVTHTPGYDTLNRAWLASALLVLRGYENHTPVACSTYSWSQIAGQSKASKSRRELPRFDGGLLEYHLRLLTTPSALDKQVQQEDAEWISSHYEVFNRIVSESASFRLGLEAAIDWRFAKEPRSAVARLWAGIEAIFGISSELVYRISILSASLLEERGPNRKLRFDEIKKLYSLRSKAVHGDNISDKNLVDAMDGSFHLLRQILLLSIEKGRALGNTDFEEALFW